MPDEVIAHEPGGCAGCGMDLSGTPAAGVTAPVQYGPRLTAISAYLWHGQFLSRNRTAQVLAELFGVTVSPGSVTAMVNRVAVVATRTHKPAITLGKPRG